MSKTVEYEVNALLKVDPAVESFKPRGTTEIDRVSQRIRFENELTKILIVN